MLSAMSNEVEWLWRVCEAADSLFQKNPNHELLRLFYRKDEAIWDEFQARFGRTDLTLAERRSLFTNAYFWEHYHAALEDALMKECSA